jgi:hypothetical protein
MDLAPPGFSVSRSWPIAVSGIRCYETGIGKSGDIPDDIVVVPGVVRAFSLKGRHTGPGVAHAAESRGSGF